MVRVLPGEQHTSLTSAPLDATPGEVIAGASLTRSGGVVFGPRIQRRYQLMVVHRGRFTLEREGRSFTVSEGDALILTPGHLELIRFAPDGITYHSWIGAESPPLSATLLAELETLPPVMPASPALCHIVEAAVALREMPDHAYDPLATLVASALVLFRAEAMARDTRARVPGVHPAVEAARALIMHRLHESLTLEDLAGAGHVSPVHLIRLFRTDMGVTPVRFLWAERLRVGLQLLEHTGLPITTIAANTGFRSYRHFGEVVQRATGKTPSALRHAGWTA